MWTANILTLFPDLYPGPLGSSILGEARKKWKGRGMEWNGKEKDWTGKGN